MLDNHIVSACPDGILTIDARGRITGVNDAARSMFGWPADTLIGQQVDVLIPRTLRRKHKRLIREYAEGTGRPEKMADWRGIEGQRRDGSRFPVKIWLMSQTTGGKHQTVAFIRDASETEKLEKGLSDDKAELARRSEQNALLALVAEHTTDSVIITDARGLVIWVNEATERLSGYCFDDFIGRRPGEVLQGVDTDREVARQLNNAFDAGRGFRCELLNYHRDGWSYWIELNLTPIRDARGRLQRFVAVERDITQKKQHERQLTEARQKAERAEGRFASAIEAISDGFAVFDENDRLVLVNSAYRNLIAPGSDIVVPGATWSEITRNAALHGYFDTGGEDVDVWVGKQLKVRQAGDYAETMVRFTDGRWMLRRECRTPQGEMVGIRSDVTKFKQQEEALREAKSKAERAESRLASAIDAMTEGFIIYDEYDRLVMANSAYKEMRAEDADIIRPGITFEELLSTAVRRGHFDTEGEDPDTWVQKQLTKRKSGTKVETMVRFTNGRWMLRRERRTPQGEMIGIRSDVTAFKRQEAALEEARERAEAADRAKSEFVANISHELRTPINGISGFNQLMLTGELSEKQRERAEIIKASADHLLQLVNDLLDLSRIASNSVELEPALLEVSELSSEVIELMTPLATQNGLTIAAQTGIPAGARIHGDRSRIKQILLNLLGNAIKFTEQGGVTLTVEETDGGIAFAVTDTGPGMPEDKLKTIFDRFAQLKHERAGIQGAGLGLAITRGLVDLMGGEIDVQSELGKGSVFTARLPLPLLPPENDPDVPEPDKKKSAAGERRPDMYDVLVAEDHPFNQVLISEILDSIGCRVTMAENGQQALDQIEANAFDLIIMDNQMPVMTGLEAIRHIRARSDWKTRIPILALTANAMRGAERDYEAHGVEQFMTKPLDVNRVIEAVKRLGGAGRKLREEACSTVN